VQFGRETWSLSVPDGWTAHHDDECATLLGPGEGAVVQISAYFKDSDFIDEDLLEFASDQIDAGLTPISDQAGVFQGFRFEWREEQESFQFCYFRHSRQMLFVSYIDEYPIPIQSERHFREILDSLSEAPGPAA